MAQFLLMMSFVGALLCWLRYEFGNKYSFWGHWPWLAAALIMQPLSRVLYLPIDDRVVANLVLHGVGGGVFSGLLFVYLIKTYAVSLKWRLELAALFCFVAGLGVINELFEYVADAAIHYGVFSWDRFDTWRDLAANTSGAVIAWLFYRIITAMSKNTLAK